jgi:hypothetical protein
MKAKSPEDCDRRFARALNAGNLFRQPDGRRLFAIDLPFVVGT